MIRTTPSQGNLTRRSEVLYMAAMQMTSNDWSSKLAAIPGTHTKSLHSRGITTLPTFRPTCTPGTDFFAVTVLVPTTTINWSLFLSESYPWVPSTTIVVSNLGFWGPLGLWRLPSFKWIVQTYGSFAQKVPADKESMTRTTFLTIAHSPRFRPREK